MKNESGKTRKTQQLVASSVTPKIDLRIKCKHKQKIKSKLESVTPNNKKHSPGLRQTFLSDYFTSPDKEAPPACKSNQDETVEKMINVQRLMSQLLRARVVLKRIPLPAENSKPPMKTDAPITATKACSTTSTSSCDDNSGADLQSVNRPVNAVQRYCLKCKTLEIDREDVTKYKCCRKCATLLLFVCNKCNVKHFIEYRSMRRHTKVCCKVTDQTTKPNIDLLASAVLRYCKDCSFKTTYEFMMDRHVKKTGHKVMNEQRTNDRQQQTTTSRDSSLYDSKVMVLDVRAQKRINKVISCKKN